MREDDRRSLFDLAHDLERLHARIRFSNPETSPEECRDMLIAYYEQLGEIRERLLAETAVLVDEKSFDSQAALYKFLQDVILDGGKQIEEVRLLTCVRLLMRKSKPVDEDIEDFETYMEELFATLDEEALEEISELSKLAGLPDIEKDDYRLIDQYFDFSGFEYIPRKAQAAVLVVGRTELPANLMHILSEMRECYAFRRLTSVVILCRTALELSLREVYEEEGFTEPGSHRKQKADEYFDRKSAYRLPDRYELPLFDLQNLICGLPKYQDLQEDISEIRVEANSVVHGNKVPTEESAQELMRLTINVIHELYAV